MSAIQSMRIARTAPRARRKSLPDTRLVATDPRGRSGFHRDLDEKLSKPFFVQIALMAGAHVGCRADQASIGERLSAVPGMRPIICVGEA